MKHFIPAFILALTTLHAADPLPASRTPAGQGNWTGLVGVPGGIPDRTTIFQTMPAGSSLSAVQTAVNTCPDNQVVLLSAGTYSWGGTLYLTNSNTTLRGAGPTQTIITSGSIEVGDFNPWWAVNEANSTANNIALTNPQNWTGGLTQGTTTITVASTSGYSVGQLIILSQLNDAHSSLSGVEGVTINNYYSYNFPHTGEDRALHQINRIASISGNQITLTEPVYRDFSAALDPEVWRFSDQPTIFSGVEGIRLSSGVFRIHCAYACWVYNTYIAETKNVQDNGFLLVFWSLRCSIIKNTITSNDGLAPDSYGFESRASAGLLVENNIVDNLGPAMQPNGVSGSVFAYNFLNDVTSGSSGMSAGFIQHGGFPWFNLFEGNVVPCIAMDNTDAIAFSNTMHRNWAQGIDQTRTAISNVFGIQIGGENHDMTATGNVIGTAGVTYDAYTNGPTFSGTPVIFSVGFWSGESGGPWDSETLSTFIRGYNWNEFNDAIVSESGAVASDIPASRYLTSKPTWFGTLPWPPIDPDNPTVSRSSTNIPAGYRFINGVDPPAGSTMNIETLNVTNLRIGP